MVSKAELSTLASRIEALWSEGRLSAARQALGEAIEVEPDAGCLWELLGLVAFEMNDHPEAQSALERASLLSPLSARGQLALAKCYGRSGHRQSAAAIYCHVATLRDLEASLLEPLAAGLGRIGKFELALNVCRRAAREMPENPDPWIGIVHYMRRLRRPLEQIMPAMYRAHQLEPGKSEYRITLAWLLHEMGRTDEAAKLITPVEYDTNSCVRCLTLMMQVFERAGDAERTEVCRARLDIVKEAGL